MRELSSDPNEMWAEIAESLEEPITYFAMLEENRRLKEMEDVPEFQDWAPSRRDRRAA